MARKAQDYYSNNVPQCVYICSDIPREHMQIRSDKDIPEYHSWWKICLASYALTMLGQAWQNPQYF